MKAMCLDSTGSVLRNKSTQEMETFEWATLISELDRHAPVFLQILKSCTLMKKPRENHDAVIEMCAAIVLKHQFAKMSLVQRILSMILYAEHSGKQVCPFYALAIKCM